MQDALFQKNINNPFYRNCELDQLTDFQLQFLLHKYYNSRDIFSGQQHHRQAPQQNDATKDAAHIASIHKEEDDNNASNIVIFFGNIASWQILTSGLYETVVQITIDCNVTRYS